MLVTTTNTDLLPQIDANILIETQTVTTFKAVEVLETTEAVGSSGSYKFFEAFEFTWNFSTNPVSVKIDLYVNVPIVGKIHLAHGTIDAQHPTIVIGGGAYGFKAQLTLSFNFNTHTLSVQTQACIPMRCYAGNFSIQL